MKLYEIQSPTSSYYLASNAKLGQTATYQDLKILPEGRYHLTEAILEKFRPVNCLQRASSILLVRSPEDLQALGQNAHRMYRVVSIEPAQWSDAQWVQRVREAMELPFEERPLCGEWAQAYWGGTACPMGEPLWEGRTHAVQVVETIR